MLATLAVPDGTAAEVAFPRASGVEVDGKPHAGGLLGPGRHVIVAKGMDARALEDKSLLAGFSADAGEHWFSAAPPAWTRDSCPDTEFVQTIDLGAVRNVLAVEVTAGQEDKFPAELRVDVSPDGATWTQQRELTGLSWPGEGKTLTVDLRTVGSALSARAVRIRLRRPKGVLERKLGITYYKAGLAAVRVKYMAE